MGGKVAVVGLPRLGCVQLGALLRLPAGFFGAALGVCLFPLAAKVVFIRFAQDGRAAQLGVSGDEVAAIPPDDVIKLVVPMPAFTRRLSAGTAEPAALFVQVEAVMPAAAGAGAVPLHRPAVQVGIGANEVV